jgi:hypothetical protein
MDKNDLIFKKNLEYESWGHVGSLDEKKPKVGNPM